MKTVQGEFTHEWVIDLHWHMGYLKDWFYMVNVGYIEPTIFLHVRVLGVRSLWTFSHLKPFAMHGSEILALIENVQKESMSVMGVPRKYFPRSR